MLKARRDFQNVYGEEKMYEGILTTRELDQYNKIRFLCTGNIKTDIHL